MDYAKACTEAQPLFAVAKGTVEPKVSCARWELMQVFKQMWRTLWEGNRIVLGSLAGLAQWLDRQPVD